MWNKLAILVALVLGVLSVIMVRNYIENERNKVKGTLILVCVAQTDIAENTKINTDHIGYREMPLQYKPSNAFFWKDRASVLGLMTTAKIKARDYFMDNMFIKAEASTTLSPLKVPQGLRAMSLQMNGLSGVSGLCRPGDHVDVIATFGVQDVDQDNVLANQTMKTITMTILPNVLIAALDQNTGKFGEEFKGNYGSATFYFTPFECEVLTFFMEAKRAKLNYVLRAANEPDVSIPAEPNRVTEERSEQQLKEMLRQHNAE
ncbi:MAG: Flp pilus assembly protein CpaB [Planctomycetota bacterium]